MNRTSRRAQPVLALSACLGLALVLSACGGKEEKPAEDKPAEKQPEPEPEPDTTPAEPRFDLSGPKPPETSSVVFAVDGALAPMACFDKDKGALAAGADCAALVAEGSEVYMEDSYGKKSLDKTLAGNKDSTCGDKGALPTAELDGGANYDWGVWPKSLGGDFTQIDPDTWSDRGARLEDAEQEAVLAAITKVRNVKGEFQSKQKAATDVDGDGKDDVFISAIMLNPNDPDTYLFSGLFMAPGGDMANLVLLDRAKKGADVIRLRGTVDLDGDGKRELWTGITFDGGDGNRMMKLGDKPEALGKWTCGA
ncbi:hypothetical protein [Plesiocystis pacifica]|uniref:hypothetical protein n=1 Tax=Plesiocystis pacifica TaxID=191768 RepID=UPI0012F91720|nr:hypothetical protein [Plesiocystis pacifica]